jgi:hypothetical protein
MHAHHASHFVIIGQPSPSRSEASARKNVDVVRDWDLQSRAKIVETSSLLALALPVTMVLALLPLVQCC